MMSNWEGSLHQKLTVSVGCWCVCVCMCIYVCMVWATSGLQGLLGNNDVKLSSIPAPKAD
jgi:hypothetical protein